jgi:hypothetical protein
LAVFIKYYFDIKYLSGRKIMSSFADPKIVKPAVQAGSASSKLIQYIAPVISEGLIQDMELEQREKYKTKKAEKGKKTGSFN